MFWEYCSSSLWYSFQEVIVKFSYYKLFQIVQLVEYLVKTFQKKNQNNNNKKIPNWAERCNNLYITVFNCNTYFLLKYKYRTIEKRHKMFKFWPFQRVLSSLIDWKVLESIYKTVTDQCDCNCYVGRTNILIKNFPLVVASWQEQKCRPIDGLLWARSIQPFQRKKYTFFFSQRTLDFFFFFSEWKQVQGLSEVIVFPRKGKVS